MQCNFTDMRRKEVVNLNTGTKYGAVNDFIIDTKTAQIVSLSVGGRAKFFGLFGKEEDYIINWQDIVTIGGDVILVNCEPSVCKKSVKNFFKDFFI